MSLMSLTMPWARAPVSVKMNAFYYEGDVLLYTSLRFALQGEEKVAQIPGNMCPQCAMTTSQQQTNNIFELAKP